MAYRPSNLLGLETPPPTMGNEENLSFSTLIAGGSPTHPKSTSSENVSSARARSAIREAILDHRMKRKSKPHLEGIYRQPKAVWKGIIRMLPKQRNMKFIFLGNIETVSHLGQSLDHHG
ncbi:hypothetical protein BHE74_00041078 [Ensete ventricosum]|nr:hypothetical protein BHE74_00041078 [Ensete ventricosum]